MGSQMHFYKYSLQQRTVFQCYNDNYDDSRNIMSIAYVFCEKGLKRIVTIYWA